MLKEKDTSRLTLLLLSLGLITFVAAIAYLPLIRQFGWYRDDWYLIWSGHTIGTQKIIEIFSTDRPIVGYLYALTYTLFGDNPLPWNIFSITLRYISFLSVFWIVSILWPKKYYMNTMITLLFVIYPGFLQQPNANTFSNLFLTFTIALISIALSLQAAKTNSPPVKILLIIISSVLTAFYLITGEYLIGLEGVRFALLWYQFRRSLTGSTWKSSLLNTVSHALPNLIIAGAVIIWRIFFFESTRPAMNVDTLFDRYTSSPFYSILRFIVEYLKDQFEITFGAWSIPVYNLANESRLREYSLSLILLCIAILAVLLYAYICSKKDWGRNSYQDGNSINPKELVILGIVCVALASLPVILSNRNVIYRSNWDRYTLQSSFGAVLVVYGFLCYLSKPWLRVSICALLIGIGVSTHYNNAVKFREVWEAQRQLWWQLTWRAPQIAENTVLLSNTDRYHYEEDYESWAPANLIYYPESPELKIFTEVLDIPTIQKVLSSSWDRGATRTIEYERDYDNTLVATIPSPMSCLQVIDGNRPVISEFGDETLNAIAPYSQIERILVEKEVRVPSTVIFGPEPEHDWCYYFQKASLAAQQGDWQRVASLGDDAQNHGLKPSDWSEWWPFIQGYAYTGQNKQAKKLIPILKELPYVRVQVCQILEKENNLQPVEGTQYLYENICLRK